MIVLTKYTPDKTSLYIRGREIKYEPQLIDINELRFYKKNPRIASILAEQTGEITDKTIDEILWEEPETHDLCNSIKKDGGLLHPIVVYNSEVLEGNTRLCCYRHLYEITKNEKWKYIKSYVIKEKLTQDEIYRLLCTEHIEGKIEWEAYEKANLYCKMRDEERMTLEQIHEIAGESKPTISNRIRAYTLMVENGVKDKNKYSHFEQLVLNGSIKNIKENQDPDIENKIIELIKLGKIPEAQDIRKIGEIYKHKIARKRLFEQKEDITQVYHDLKAAAPMTDSAFMKDIEGLIIKIKKLERMEREGLRQSNRDCNKIEQLVKELINLCRELDIQIHIPEKLRKS